MKELELFINHLKIRGKSSNTIRAFSGNINEFFSIMEIKNLSDLESLKRIDFEKYLSILESKGNVATTKNAKLSAVNSFFEFLLKNEIIEKNVVKTVDRAKMPIRHSVQPTKDEAKTILKSVKNRPQLYCLYKTLMGSGMRIEECLNLKLSDFRDDCLYVLGKGNKTRIIPLNEETASELKKYISSERKVWTKEMLIARHNGNMKLVEQGLADSDRIFLGKNGLRMYDSNICISLSKTAKNCGIGKEKVHPHAFRHYFANEFVNQGGTVTGLQSVLGHESLKTTQIYFDQNMEAVKLQMSKMSF